MDDRKELDDEETLLVELERPAEESIVIKMEELMSKDYALVSV